MLVLKRSSKKSYKSDGLRIDFDAGKLTNNIVEAVHDRILENMEVGREPDGTPKPAKRKGTLPRGVTERRKFVDSIGRRRARGKRRAKAAITHQLFFRRWLEREEIRGIDHFSIPHDVVDAEIKRYLDNSIK